MSSNLKRASDPVTPVKAPKVAKKGVQGPEAVTPVMGSKSPMPQTVLPGKGTGGWENVYTVEGDVTNLSRQEEGRVGVMLRVEQDPVVQAWVWMSREQVRALGKGLVLGCRISVEAAAFKTSSGGYHSMELTPRKGYTGAAPKVKLLPDRAVTRLTDLVLSPSSKTEPHHVIGFVGARVVEEGQKAQYLLLWNRKTAEGEKKAVAVASYFPFDEDVQVGCVVRCGPVLHVSAGKVRAVKGFKTYVSEPGVPKGPSAKALMDAHDADFMASETAESVRVYMSDWEDVVATELSDEERDVKEAAAVVDATDLM